MFLTDTGQFKSDVLVELSTACDELPARPHQHFRSLSFLAPTPDNPYIRKPTNLLRFQESRPTRPQHTNIARCT